MKELNEIIKLEPQYHGPFNGIIDVVSEFFGVNTTTHEINNTLHGFKVLFASRNNKMKMSFRDVYVLLSKNSELYEIKAFNSLRHMKCIGQWNPKLVHRIDLARRVIEFGESFGGAEYELKKFLGIKQDIETEKHNASVNSTEVKQAKIYKGKLFISTDDIKKMHGLSEDSIVIPQIVNGEVEFLIGSTEKREFMLEDAIDFYDTRRHKLLSPVQLEPRVEGDEGYVNISCNLREIDGMVQESMISRLCNAISELPSPPVKTKSIEREFWDAVHKLKG